MSVSLKEAYKWAAKYDSKLKAGEFDQTVHLQMDDCSLFVFSYAIAVERAEDDFLYVFTEHYGFHVYSKDDIDRYRIYKHGKVKKVK